MAYEGPHPLPVPSGGTGDASFTTYAPVCGGTTTIAHLQQATTGFSTSGFVLTSNGNAALPSWQSGGGLTSIVIQTFTTSGTYTPTTGMIYCIVEAVGAGGGGGGADSTTAHNAGSGGGAGGYSRKSFSAATIGASQTVTIGAAGTGVSASNGNNGGATTFGALLTANGGSGGLTTGGSTAGVAGGAGGTASSGTINITGQAGGYGGGEANSLSGTGGSNLSYGEGGPQIISNATSGITGLNATGFGAGGGGGLKGSGGSDVAGGSGTAGIVVVTEFV